jgi:hypothetical protein
MFPGINKPQEELRGMGSCLALKPYPAKNARVASAETAAQHNHTNKNHT